MHSFGGYSSYSYSGLGITEYTEFQFRKERSLIWKQTTHGGGDLRTTIRNFSTDVFEPRTGLTLQMRWRQNAPKRKKIQLPVDVRGSKTSLLKFPNKNVCQPGAAA